LPDVFGGFAGKVKLQQSLIISDAMFVDVSGIFKNPLKHFLRYPNNRKADSQTGQRSVP